MGSSEGDVWAAAAGGGSGANNPGLAAAGPGPGSGAAMLGRSAVSYQNLSPSGDLFSGGPQRPDTYTARYTPRTIQLDGR